MRREVKDSGIEWIGEIPANWSTVRLKNVAKIITGNTPSKSDNSYYSDDGLSWVKPDNLNYFNGFTPTKEKLNSEGKALARIVPKNTLLICCIGSIGKFGYATEEVAFNQQINAVVFDCSKIFWKYGIYYMSVQDEQQKYYQNGNVVFILNTENQKKVVLTFPPLLEQLAIADYLDHKCSLIDSTIEKEKAIIEKLKLYKQSVITEAVTKGLDPIVKMKPSGIEWIGDIPEGWEVKKLKYVFTIKKEIAGEEGYDILAVTQIGIKIKDISNNEGQISQDYSKYQHVEIGDFVMNHMDLLTGFVDCSKYKGVTSPDYRVFILNNTTLNSKKFYTYLFQICYKNKIFYGLGQGVSSLGRWRLQSDKFLNFEMPVPPLSEQQAIADYLYNKCTGIDNVIDGKQKLIKKLTDYKKSLIYECVTGKKEVI